jgi:hypothetical protein
MMVYNTKIMDFGFMDFVQCPKFPNCKKRF